MTHDPHRFDVDAGETREWLDALAAVVRHDGAERAAYLVRRLLEEGGRLGVPTPDVVSTPYLNTLPAEREPRFPGDLEVERRLTAILRWNAMATVVRSNRADGTIGGHIATYQSVATLFETGFHHFWRASTEARRGDLVFFQGHASPGIYARAFLDGRLDEADLDGFRREVDGNGLPSYPHPWLMPGFWQFASVSMGLGPLMAIYQARFQKYLEARGLLPATDRKVWAFCGDGEMDEVEALGALGVASRERLDNLIFVVNCNLQRLDGPVRGNGKIIQELEGHFRGAGWNVIKVIWGSEWDALLDRDAEGRLRQRMEEAVDGDYQGYAAKGGAYLREHFFGRSPELQALVAHLSDDELASLRRGGHDPLKVYAAYRAAVETEGRPTVVLAKTIKGFGMGKAGQGQNPTHQLKKLDDDTVRYFRDFFAVPIPDETLAEVPFYRPPADSPEMRYLRERRSALGGPFPQRRTDAPMLEAPPLAAFEALLRGSDRESSTTLAFVRILQTLLRDANLKDRIVPIVADEARTFGMEGLFAQIGIYAPGGQRYEPVDAHQQLQRYREEASGQVLQEGISEAGALSSWVAAGMSYSTHGVRMVPFFIFYSMFGFQRVADLVWAAADMGARGFLMGATAGRTTLNGEGLQHEDGHSHLVSATVPNCVSYDPTYAYELAVIVRDGLRRMMQEDENVLYYLTVMNEAYAQPAMPEGVEEGILRGLYKLRETLPESRSRVQLLGSGTILREVEAAAELLAAEGVGADVWSATSFTELRRDGLAVERWNRLHPGETPRRAYVETQLDPRRGPVVAASDYLKAFADQIRAWVPGRYHVLGTDGFGRSDTRDQLRHFFEVDRRWVAVAALKALAEEGTLPVEKVVEAIRKHGIDPEKPEPTRV